MNAEEERFKHYEHDPHRTGAGGHYGINNVRATTCQFVISRKERGTSRQVRPYKMTKMKIFYE
jgi:hypothetical protein